MSRHKHRGCGHRSGGSFTRRLAARLGIARQWVIAGFIFLVIVNFPLALLVLGLAWFWLNKPHVVEKAGDTISSFGQKMGGRKEEQAEVHQAAAPEDGPTSFDPESDPWFKDLRRRFKELEERTGDMEQFVVSKEYKLRRDFKQMGEA